MKNNLGCINLCLFIKDGKTPLIHIEDPFICLEKEVEIELLKSVIDYFKFIFNDTYWFNEFYNSSMELVINKLPDGSIRSSSIELLGFDGNKLSIFVNILKVLSIKELLYINETKFIFKILID